MSTILLMHRGGSSVRGSEQCLIQNAAALHAAGLRLVLLRNDSCIDQAIGPHVTRIVPFDFPEIMLAGRHTRVPIDAYRRQLGLLRRIMADEQADLLFTNGGLPCQLAVPAGKLSRRPVLCQFHHPATRRYLLLWMVNRVDRLIFPSDFTRRVVRDRTGRDGTVIYNGVNTTTFAPPTSREPQWRRELGISEHALVFGQVAALVPHKRQALLMEAFARIAPTHPHAHLVLVGTGTDHDRLTQRSRELGLEQRIHLTGYVAATLPYYQHVFDVNVLMSAEEGLGISIIEGSATGLPAIAADATGLREAAIHERSALLVPVDDLDALAHAMERLADDADLRKRLGDGGRAVALSTFSADRYGDAIVQSVMELMYATPGER